MSKTVKILLGIATLWPIMYMFLFLAFFLYMFTTFAVAAHHPHAAGPPDMYFLIFPVHILTIFWIFALTAIYVVNIFKNDRVSKETKALWAVVIFLGNMLAMPVYWYLFIWREPPVLPKEPT
jgi:hypothetical protein